MAKAESDIQKSIIAYLRARGIHCWRSYSGPEIHGNGFKVKSQTPGRPDVEGILAGGTYLGIEVKQPKAHRRPEQIEWIQKAKDLGAVALFAECLDDVVIALSKLEESA